MLSKSAWRRSGAIFALTVMLIVLAAELLLTARRQSQTFDESLHLYAGYCYWELRDFGINPEHPPLAKLIAALPLLPLRLTVQPPAEGSRVRDAAAFSGIQFLYSHDADAILFRSRAVLCVFALALALLVFMAAREMFGLPAGFIALLLLVFEPNIIANGSLVTTDMALTCCLFGAIYLFYRYTVKPSLGRLVLCGFAVGLTIAVKHSGILVFPLLVILAIMHAALPGIRPEEGSRRRAPGDWGKQAISTAGSLVAVGVISIAVLWSSYGFRYRARPASLEITPPANVYALHSRIERGVLKVCNRYRLFPEAYLFGLTDVSLLSENGRPAFLLGKLYPQGRWFYFPAAFAIKSTIGFLLLLLFCLAALGALARDYLGELVFFLTPPLFWLGIAVGSKLNIGLRHILPIYPFLIVVAAAGGGILMQRSRRWRFIVVLLLGLHVVSSVRAYPNYLPYSNEFWGGAGSTYKFLADSNVGWADGLKATEKYLTSQQAPRCWFAYAGPVDPAYYRIPCAPLPTAFSNYFGRAQGAVPEEIDGPVLVSSEELAGITYGPDGMNPYEQFRRLTPTAVLGGEVLVFQGRFAVPKIAAFSHFAIANGWWRQGQPNEAEAEARIALSLDPDFFPAHELLATIYAKTGRQDQAQREYETTVRLYESNHPEFGRRIYGPPRNPLSEN